MIKSLMTAFVWIMALAIAASVWWRWRRGRVVMMRGKLGPTLVRMVVILLIAWGGSRQLRSQDDQAGRGAGQTPSEERSRRLHLQANPSTDRSLPDSVNPQSIRTWLWQQQPHPHDGSHPWMLARNAAVRLRLGTSDRIELPQSTQVFLKDPRHGAMGAILADEIQRLQNGTQAQPVSCAKLIESVDALQNYGIFDHWLAALVWQRSETMTLEDSRQAIELYQRLATYSRITNALVRARFEVRPITLSPRAWMSKGGPGRKGAQEEGESLAQMLKATKRIYSYADLGTWQRDAVAVFHLADGEAKLTMIREGKARTVPSGGTIYFNRLDVFRTPADQPPVQLRHHWLETIELPPGRTIRVWDLPNLLSADAREMVQTTLDAAMKGDASAAERIQHALPLVFPWLRQQLADQPEAPGAPRLRLILALFQQ